MFTIMPAMISGKEDDAEEQQHAFAPVEDDPADIEGNRQRHQANAQAKEEDDGSAAARDAHGDRVILPRSGARVNKTPGTNDESGERLMRKRRLMRLVKWGVKLRELVTGVLPYLDSPYRATAKLYIDGVRRSKGLVANRLFVFMIEDQSVAILGGGCAKIPPHFEFRETEGKPDRQVDLSILRPTSRIWSCLFGNSLPSKTVDGATTHFAALEPEHPSALRVRAVKAEPLKRFTRITS